MISLYIHIPFCVKKCLYCDFLSFSCDSETKKDLYTEALCREIELTECRETCVSSVFIGGGTPTVFEVSHIKKIMDTIRERYVIDSEAEISIECNPGTASLEKLRALRLLGFNRLSIGLQSASDDELKILGRIHNYRDFLNTFRWAREAGFNNINVDIMSALPGQSLENYKKTVTSVVKMHPEHISAYSLIIEENTEYYRLYGDDTRVREGGLDGNLAKADVLSLPDEDTEREMYYCTERILEEGGYRRYEISNYARPGFKCRHNIVYWRGTDYISFGLGASSYVNGVRYNNIRNLDEYIMLWGGSTNEDSCRGDGGHCVGDKEENPDKYPYVCPDFNSTHTDIQVLTVGDKQEEYMIVGLRLMEGVSVSEFLNRFGVSVEDVYGRQLQELSKQGLIDMSGDNIRLTSRGIDVSNYVLSEFIQEK